MAEAEGTAPPAETAEVVVEKDPLIVAVEAAVPGLEGVQFEENRVLTHLVIPDPERIVDVCRFLKESPDYAFNMLIEIVAVDYWDAEPRYGLVYILHSFSRNERIYLQTRVPSDEPTLPTLTTLWSSANWMERDAFDMFGIRFRGHPDLRKIRTPDDLEGHPMRKDFPLGNVDVWPEGAGTNVAR